MNDFIASSHNVEEAYHVTTTAKQILSTAGMDLCKWMTKSHELEKKWEESTAHHTLAPETHGAVLRCWA